MADLLARVIVGNIGFHPEVLRDFLKKSHYYMQYKAETETITFSVNDGSGGRDVFWIKNASHENAAKLAEGLGLRADGRGLTFWSKWNPAYVLRHNGSPSAERLRMEMFNLRLPFKQIPSYNEWAWNNGSGSYEPPMWTVDQVIERMREEARLYRKQLDSKP